MTFEEVGKYPLNVCVIVFKIIKKGFWICRLIPRMKMRSRSIFNIMISSEHEIKVFGLKLLFLLLRVVTALGSSKRRLEDLVHPG